MATVKGWHGRRQENPAGVEEQVWCGACDWRATVTAKDSEAIIPPVVAKYFDHARTSHPEDEPSLGAHTSVGQWIGIGLLGVVLLEVVFLLISLLAQAGLVILGIAMVIGAVVTLFMKPDLAVALGWIAFFLITVGGAAFLVDII